MAEIPRSQEQGRAHPQVFNLGALSVGDIARLNMAFRMEEAHLDEFSSTSPPRDQAGYNERFKFIYGLRGAIQQLASEDFDRAKEVVTALRDDHSPANTMGYSQELAAELTPALIPYDYEFARDTLLAIRYDSRAGHPGDNPYASDTATGTMPEFEERLTPKQRADYDFHAQRWLEDGLPPTSTPD